MQSQVVKSISKYNPKIFSHSNKSCEIQQEKWNQMEKGKSSAKDKRNKIRVALNQVMRFQNELLIHTCVDLRSSVGFKALRDSEGKKWFKYASNWRREREEREEFKIQGQKKKQGKREREREREWETNLMTNKRAKKQTKSGCGGIFWKRRIETLETIETIQIYHREIKKKINFFTSFLTRTAQNHFKSANTMMSKINLTFQHSSLPG